MPCARRDLVTEDEARQEFTAVDGRGRLIGLGAVDHAKERRQDRRAGMSLGQHMAVVRVERVDRRGAGEGGTGETRAPAIEEHARIAVAAE
jgi:hypothetical protein